MLDLGDVLEIGFHVVGWVLEVGAAVPTGGAPTPPPAPAFVAPVRGPSPTRLEARVLDAHAPDAERLAALAALLGDAQHDATNTLLLLLDDASVAVRTEAIHAAGKRRLAAAYPRLCRGYFSPEEGAALATALARIGGAKAEPRLLLHLERGETPVKLAAARALKHVGTLRAIEPLRAHANAWFSGELGTEALAAILGIQRRLAVAAPGAISLHSGSGGELSLREEGGALSLPRTEHDE